MKIIIGADVVPVESNTELFISGDPESLIGEELSEILKDADYRICNLEVPLADRETPVTKFGPNLIAPTACVNGLKAIGINAVTLANNHILDQGAPGLTSTLQALDEAGIAHVGAGKNLNDAREPMIRTIGNKRCGIYACSEHEFSVAADHSPGANPWEEPETSDRIREIRKQCDYLIVLYHGGKEHYRYPSPGLRKTCRKMVEKGADLVVCQHSHCIGCREDYLQGTIIYGQGNFIFPKLDNEFWNTGLLISTDGEGKIDYIPMKRDGRGIRLASGGEGEKILEEFERRSGEIRKDEFVEAEYARFADENIDEYIRYFSEANAGLLYRGINTLARNRIREWVIRRYLRKKRTGLINYIECEAHRELLLAGLKSRTGR